MEIWHERFRWMILYDFKFGLTQRQCFERLNAAFGDKVPSKTTIYNWFAEFKRGRIGVSDEPHGHRQKTAVVPEKVDAVRELIEEDCHTTYGQIRASLGIGMKATQKILHDELGMRKLCARWILHNLKNEQKKARVK